MRCLGCGRPEPGQAGAAATIRALHCIDDESTPIRVSTYASVLEIGGCAPNRTAFLVGSWGAHPNRFASTRMDAGPFQFQMTAQLPNSCLPEAIHTHRPENPSAGRADHITGSAPCPMLNSLRDAYDRTVPRRPINLSLNGDLIAKARSENLNLSSIAEEARRRSRGHATPRTTAESTGALAAAVWLLSPASRSEPRPTRPVLELAERHAPT